jgi:hypothetical protein
MGNLIGTVGEYRPVMESWPNNFQFAPLDINPVMWGLAFLNKNPKYTLYSY